MKGKRGLSTIIASMLMVVLTILSVGIIWVVIQNIISKGAEDVSLDSITANLEIKNVNVNFGRVDVRIKRNVGAGDISGIKIAVFDGIDTQIFEQKIPLNELEEKTFNLNYSGVVKEVSVSPILKSSSGKEKTGSQTENFVFTNYEAVKNINGLVSWWKFEGNANDEMGRNNGNLIGGIDCNYPGKYGKACKFDGMDDSINLGNNPSLQFNLSDLSVLFWIKMNPPMSGTNPMIFQKGGNNGRIWIYTPNTGTRVFINCYFGLGMDFYMGDVLPIINTNDGQFHHIATIFNKTGLERIFVDNDLDGSKDISPGAIIPWDTSENAILSPGTNGKFNGSIDELMIFNRSLSAEEIRSLYSLDLS